jgi:hypothetical protein
MAAGALVVTEAFQVAGERMGERARWMTFLIQSVSFKQSS